jgi:hypothetical protein
LVSHAALNETEANDTVTGVGCTLLAGVGLLAGDDDELVSTGSLGISGVALVTDGDDGLTATGIGRAAIVATLMRTEAGDTLISTAQIEPSQIEEWASWTGEVHVHEGATLTGHVTNEAIIPAPVNNTFRYLMRRTR